MGPFHYHADFPLAPYEPLMDDVVQLQDDLGRLLNVQPPREPILLFFFARRATYSNYVRHYFPSAPDRPALYIKQRGPGMVLAHLNRDFEVDVRHESTHALLHAALPMVPLWLDEGLAEYFELPAPRRAHHHPHLSSLRWRLRFGRPTRVEQLEAIQRLEEMGPAEYRNAWGWAHFMLHGPPEANEELLGFLAAVQAHSPPGLLSDRLRRRIPQLQRQFSRHVLDWGR